MTEATLTLAGTVSRPAQTPPIWFFVSRSPIMMVLLVPSVMDRMLIAEPPSLTCSLTA